MTLEEYRILHSTLIEAYQWIEFDLEGIYAASSGEPFMDALEDIEKDSIGGIVHRIKGVENRRDIDVLTDADLQELEELRRRRNFWCHVCYTEVYGQKDGVPRNAERLAADLRDAQELMARVRRIKEQVFADRV